MNNDEIKGKLQEEWFNYVDSYKENSSKRMHLLSCSHVVLKLINKGVDSHKN